MIPNATAWTARDLVAKYARRDDLHAVERIWFDRHAARLVDATVLDVGCGGGRLASRLAAEARSYIGVDYSTPMVEACRSRFPHLDFRVDDVCQLVTLGDASVDVAVVAYNGLDYVDHEGRALALRALRRVLAPGGLLLFTAHNLGALQRPFAEEIREWGVRSAIRRRVRDVRLNGPRRPSRTVDHVVWNDGAHGARLVTYYVRPTAQVRALVDAGFAEIRVDRRDGTAVAAPDEVVDPWVAYEAWRRP